ncbi:unnamed protein product [Paramecium sonneborni]|uniref:Uncharacterized protein n=1 Tax=Paramecium sonneborni TaxID=65129 RepID=A0A8S1MLW2_9CILI|nr:unnamed protein product [Paramecium sonneborni]
MGSSCKSLKNVKESNDFDIPEEEGAIKTLGQEPIPKKPYCCFSNELTEQCDNNLQLAITKQIGIPENQIFYNSIFYSREIFRAEQFQKIQKSHSKKKANKFNQYTGAHNEKQLYKQLKMNILSSEEIIKRQC